VREEDREGEEGKKKAKEGIATEQSKAALVYGM